jgi:tetratricopeptide (TPR) repeat protein
MKTQTKIVALMAVLLAMLAGTGCQKLKARDQLNKGVQAYKNAKYEQAIDHFKNAVELDPKLTNARLYLATAYAQQFIPGVQGEENMRNANMAIEQFQKVLDNDSKNVHSVKGIASLYFNMNEFDKAKEYHRKVIELDPNDPEPYYSIGVIDWTQSYKPRLEEKAKIGLKPEDPIKDKKVCEKIRENNMPLVEDGMQNLEKALQLREDYDNAMAYLNLMYRERADIQCGDEAARNADIAQADQWAAKTMETIRARAEKENQDIGGIHLEQQPQGGEQQQQQPQEQPKQQ